MCGLKVWKLQLLRLSCCSPELCVVKNRARVEIMMSERKELIVPRPWMCPNQGSPSPSQTLRGGAYLRCDLPEAATIRIFENFVRMLPTPLFTTLWPHWAILGNQCDHLKMSKGLVRSYFESRVRFHGVQNDLDDTKMTKWPPRPPKWPQMWPQSHQKLL